MKSIQISLASAPAGFDDMLAVLTLMIMSLDGDDVPQFREPFKEWWKASLPVTKKLGVAVALQKEANLFLRNKLELTGDDAKRVQAILKPAVALVQRDTSVDKDRLAYFRDCVLLFGKESEPAMGRMTKRVSMLGKRDLAKALVQHRTGDEEAAADHDTAKKMSDLVEQITGRKGSPLLTQTELAAINKGTDQKKKDLLAKYSPLRKQFMENYKKALFSYIRGKDEDTAPVDEVRAYLSKLGYNGVAPGFEGRIDEVGAYYTTTGKKLNGSPGGQVTMNPRYDANADNAYVCSMQGAAGPIKFYTIDYRTGARQAKFDTVQQFINDEKAHVSAWRKDLNGTDEKKKMMATIVETVYTTSGRIGTPGNKTGAEDTYGIATMLRRHMKLFTSGAVEITFAGKKAHEQHWVIKPDTPIKKKLCALLRMYAKDKKPNEPIFALKNKPVHNNDVNRYLKAVTGMNDMTIHKVRHVQGTRLALDVLKRTPFNKKGEKPVTQSAAEKWIKEEMKEVGEKLHHATNGKVTGMTSIQSYIDPMVIRNWFENLNLRVPTWVPKK